MPISRLHLFLKRHSAWLLAFALMLPMAQAAAGWHLLSHVHTQGSERSDGHPTTWEDSCDLCLSAVALTAGAITDSSANLAPSVAVDEAIATRHTSVWFAPAQRLYQSRAPPIARD